MPKKTEDQFDTQQKIKQNKADLDLRKICESAGIAYLEPVENENKESQKSRRQRIRRNLKSLRQKSEDQFENHQKIKKKAELELKQQCESAGIAYLEPVENENKKSQKNRRDRIRRNLKRKSANTFRGAKTHAKKNVLKCVNLAAVKIILYLTCYQICVIK